MIKIDAPENVETVYNELKASFQGMEVFMKKDIPNYLHYKVPILYKHVEFIHEIQFPESSFHPGYFANQQRSSKHWQRQG